MEFWQKNCLINDMNWLFYIISSLQLIWSSATMHDGEIYLDEFQNVYELTSDELVKFDQKGNLLYTYSSISKGEIHTIDVSNPLRVLVHFKENNEVVFLDNTLSVQGSSLNFNTLGLYDVTLVCNSFQNHLWAYQSASLKLVRLDQAGTQVAETPMLSTFIDLNSLEFHSLVETGNYLYLTTKSGRVFMFDQYGNYFKEISVSASADLKFNDENVIYQTTETLILYNLNIQAVDTLFNKDELALNEVLVDFSKTHLVTRDLNQNLTLYNIGN